VNVQLFGALTDCYSTKRPVSRYFYRNSGTHTKRSNSDE